MESISEAAPATIVALPRFGEMTYADTDVIELPWGLPGFPGHTRWLILTLESQSSFVWLQSLDDLGVAIPAINPWMVFEDYRPNIPGPAFAALGIRGAADFTILCVVVVTQGAAEMTINLQAPILVNLRTRKACQVELADEAYPARQPIPRKHKECA